MSTGGFIVRGVVSLSSVRSIIAVAGGFRRSIRPIVVISIGGSRRRLSRIVALEYVKDLLLLLIVLIGLL